MKKNKKKEQHIDFEENRYGLFMSENSFDLDISYGRHYLKTDAPFVVKFYKVNVIQSTSHSLYNESKPGEKKFFTPIDLNVMWDIEEGEVKYFSESGVVRDDTGNLVFGIYDEELKEKNAEINIGDYVSLNMKGNRERFFEVASADYVSDETSRSRGGFKTYWKKITCVPVKEDTVPILSNSI